MKAPAPVTKIKYWKSEQLFDIGLGSYTLTHHSFARHFHEHFVIELVVKGADNFFCSGKTYIAVPGEFVFINPGEVHTGSTVTGGPLQYYSLAPGRDELNQVAADLEKQLPPDFCFQHSLSRQPQLANKMLSLFHAVEFFSAENLQCQELLLDLMNALIDKACYNKDENFKVDKKDVRVQLLIDFIHASFTEPISLQQMAAQVTTSPFHLIRLFKAATGLSPYEYLLVLRIEHARQLLQKGYAVHDAALESGFYDASHFNRLFRKVSGSNPKIFRPYK